MSERIAIFVDGGNMFYAQRNNNWHLDYVKIKNYFSLNRELYGAYYFTATPSSDQPEQIKRYRSFRSVLINNDWTVKDKEIKTIIDKETGDKIVKGNLDIELVFRMITTSAGWDTGYLLGGDGDYVPILEYLANSGKKIIVIGRRESTAIELINVAHQFIDLNSLREHIERKRKESP